jgi:hypothetical protein
MVPQLLQLAIEQLRQAVCGWQVGLHGVIATAVTSCCCCGSCWWGRLRLQLRWSGVLLLLLLLLLLRRQGWQRRQLAR